LVIRCERCSTLYELEEALLSPAGSPVQCTRCDHVFTAFPPSHAAGRPLVGLPAQPPSDDASPTPGDAPGASVSPPGTSNAASSVARDPHVTPSPDAPVRRAPFPVAGSRAEGAPRVARTGPPAVYRPPVTAAAPATSARRGPVLRRDAVGTFESRLRWSARLRWLVPIAGVLLLAGAAAGWFALSPRPPPDAGRLRAEAMALLARDDSASLEQAVSRLDDLVRRAPKIRAAAADLALAQVLRAAALLDEGEALSARLAARVEERDRLRGEQPPGSDEDAHGAAREVDALESQVRDREEAARVVSAAAFEGLRALQTELGDSPEVARGLAAYHALEGERDRAQRTIRSARARAPADPWLDLAGAWVDARDPDRAARDRALVSLGALSVAHPELLRGHYLLARTQAALGQRAEALATVEGLLARNPLHEGGTRLREELTMVGPAAPRALPVAAPPAPAPPVAAPAPSPAGNRMPQPRKPIPQSESPAVAPVQDAVLEPAPEGAAHVQEALPRAPTAEAAPDVSSSAFDARVTPAGGATPPAVPGRTPGATPERAAPPAPRPERRGPEGTFPGDGG
jgi:predicted Zn finger-like uncharacterized protein